MFLGMIILDAAQGRVVRQRLARARDRWACVAIYTRDPERARMARWIAALCAAKHLRVQTW